MPRPPADTGAPPDLTPWVGPWPVLGPMSLIRTRRNRPHRLYQVLLTWLRQGSSPGMNHTPESAYVPTSPHALPQGEALEQARAALWTQLTAPEQAIAAQAAFNRGAAEQPRDPGSPPTSNAGAPRRSELAYWSWAGQWVTWNEQRIHQLQGSRQLARLRGQPLSPVDISTTVNMSASARAALLIGVTRRELLEECARLQNYEVRAPSSALQRLLRGTTTWMPLISRVAWPEGPHELSRSDILPGLTGLNAWNDTPAPIVADSGHAAHRNTHPDAVLSAQVVEAAGSLRQRRWAADHPVWGLLNHLYPLEGNAGKLIPLHAMTATYGQLHERFSTKDAISLVERIARTRARDPHEAFLARQMTTGLLSAHRAYSTEAILANPDVYAPSQSRSSRDLSRARHQKNYENLLQAAAGVPGVHDQPQDVTARP